MNTYEPKNIRNIAICGSSGSGKTQFVESILFSKKIINRLGKVNEGNTVSDYDPIEKERRSSVNSSLITLETDNIKINFIDCPGYADFISGAISAIEVCETVVILVNPHDGIDSATKKMWKTATAKGKAVIVFVSFMDNANSDFSELVNSLKSTLSPNIAPVTAPVGKAESFKGVIKVLENKAVIDGKSADVPDELKSDTEKYSESLMDSVAATDDNLMEKFLDSGELNQDEIRQGLLGGFVKGEIVPVLCGSSISQIGIAEVLEFLANYAPSPLDIKSETRPIDPSGQFKAIVFKSESQQHVGQIHYIKVISGEVKSGDNVQNLASKSKIRINQIAAKRGDENIKIDAVKAGDVVSLIKVDDLKVNNTLSSSNNEPIASIEFPQPLVSRGVYPKTKGEEEKVANAFSNIIAGDPTLQFGFNSETKEMVLTGLGSLQLELVVKKIKERYDAEVDLMPPRIAYKESIRTKVEDVRGKHKKQTGGKGQYGDCVIRMMPIDRGTGFEFDNQIVGGRIPSGYIPSIEKGIVDAMEKGVIAGYPVVDLRIELYDGSYHDVDSSDMAFQLAGSKAFQLAMADANPFILEPIMKVAIKVTNEYTGTVMGDLNSRRGRVLGMEPDGDDQVVNALVPLESLVTYGDDLKSLTSGEGEYTAEFDHYEDAPMNVQQHLIEKYNKEKEEGR